MGNLCGKSSKDENFQGAGRTVGSAPAPATKASVPAKLTGPGRTVGGTAPTAADDPRAAAAAAAEARANKPVTGDLAKKLEEQKKQTRNQTLQQAAHENLAQRNADANTETRNYN